MSLSNVRASTQDTSAGTSVAIVNNEEGTAAIQVFVQAGNVTTYAAWVRGGTGGGATNGGQISAADSISGNLVSATLIGTSGAYLYNKGNALNLRVSANCTLASKILTGRVVFYDSGNNALFISPTISFTSDPTYQLTSGGVYACVPVLMDAYGALKCCFLADSVSGGVWTVTMQAL